MTFEPGPLLQKITTATDELLQTATTLDEARPIQGARTPLLAWLLGRSDGAALGTHLPRPPFLTEPR